MRRFRPGSINQYFDEAVWTPNVTGSTGRWSGRLVKEEHASTCSHCQHSTNFPSLRAMMDHVDICRGCMKLVCLACAGKPCRPWEAEVERVENEERIRAAVERAAWGSYV